MWDKWFDSDAWMYRNFCAETHGSSFKLSDIWKVERIKLIYSERVRWVFWRLFMLNIADEQFWGEKFD